LFVLSLGGFDDVLSIVGSLFALTVIVAEIIKSNLACNIGNFNDRGLFGGIETANLQKRKSAIEGFPLQGDFFVQWLFKNSCDTKAEKEKL